MCFPRGSWDFGPRKSSHSLGLALPAPFLATWETYQVFLVSRWETALDFACLGLVSPLCRVNLVVGYWLIETDLVVPSVFTIGPEPHLGVRAPSAGTRFRTRHIAWGTLPPGGWVASLIRWDSLWPSRLGLSAMPVVPTKGIEPLTFRASTGRSSN